MPVYKSKTLATWIAVLGGTFGLHRFYLRGLRDPWGWLHLPPALLGLYGVQRMNELGQDDKLAWALIPLLGFTIAAGMLAAIATGLTPDEKWDARHNPGAPARATRWGPVLGVIAALMLGAAALMATVAFSGQRYFEWQVEEGRKISQ
ncbi:hypothetical protein [Piscinibacter sp.]|uniref:hypothetical protein n=1 Tax=Piscinibacter sp. TaxID=1903157 RepID=UPI0039E64EB5